MSYINRLKELEDKSKCYISDIEGKYWQTEKKRRTKHQNYLLRPCLNVEIEHVYIICLVADSVDRFYFGSKRPYWEMRCH